MTISINEIKELLQNHIEELMCNNSEIKELLQSQKVVMYGDYLATIVFNKLFNTNKPLPLINFHSTVSAHEETLAKVTRKNTYVWVDIDYVHGATYFRTTNFNCLTVSYVDNKLNINIPDCFIELVETKQLQFNNIYLPDLVLCDLLLTHKMWEGYLFLNKEQLFKIYNDLTSTNQNFKSALKESTLKYLNLDYTEFFCTDSFEFKYYPNTLQEGLLPDYILGYFNGVRFSIVDKYPIFFKFLYGKGVKKSLRELRLEILKYPELITFSLTTRDYLKDLNTSWKDKLPGLNKLLAEHDLIHLFNGLTLNQQISLYIEINNLIKKHGLWIIGLLENQDSYNKESFIKSIQLKKLENSKWLVEPIEIPKDTLPFGLGSKWEIVELFTRQVLIEEGEYQHHCVGGYDVRENHRIFSIRQENFRYTVDIRFDFSTREWSIGQARGKYNNTLDSFSPNIQNDLEALVTWLKNNLPRPKSAKKDIGIIMFDDVV